MRLILGSGSPRRKEILGFFALPFDQIPSDFPEETVPFTGDPIAYVKTLSEKKGELLAKKYPDALILTADTSVFCKGTIYNKPEDKKQAFQFLSELAGNWHDVFTGVTLRKGDQFISNVENTRVLFHPLTPKQIHTYHENFYYGDKAGGFCVEGSGNIIVKRIEGCFYNVLGLPINPLQELFSQMGVDLWQHIKP